MTGLMQSSLPTRFAVTIAFGVGTAVIMSAMLLISAFTGREVELMRDVANWYQLGLLVAAFAAFSGLLVDGLRFLGDTLWN